MILVEVRCKTCRKLLDEVETAPATEDLWACYVPIHVCPKHGGGHGSVAKWVEAQKRLGRPYDHHPPVTRWVPWAELRPAVERARARNKTSIHPV